MTKKASRGTVGCRRCAGAVPAGDPACPYCGAVVEVERPRGADGPAERRTWCVRCASFYPAAAGRCPRCPPVGDDLRGGDCPRCARPLAPEPFGPVTVDRCPACRGVWFDGAEIERAIDVTTQGVRRDDLVSLRARLPAHHAGDEDVRYVRCVRCGELMVRKQAAPKAGVVVDVCRDHGVWFDPGELEHFEAFARAGGLEVGRHEGNAAAEARRRRPAPDAGVPPFDFGVAGLSAGLLARALRAFVTDP